MTAPFPVVLNKRSDECRRYVVQLLSGRGSQVVKRDVVRARLRLGARLPSDTAQNLIDLASTAPPLIISKEKWDGEAKHEYGVIGWLLLSLCRNGQRGNACSDSSIPSEAAGDLLQYAHTGRTGALQSKVAEDA
jgi:hypothetical protein